MMDIESVTIEPMSRTLGGQSVLKESAKMVDGDTSFEFALTRQTMETIRECVERDYEARMQEVNRS